MLSSARGSGGSLVLPSVLISADMYTCTGGAIFHISDYVIIL